ncbi:Fic family protein [Sinomonas sp. ASV322]|uniref:Fic family protein n=1 Tax=Sinomonas sp. ASV322 TaxID=3041920 RepID=UPI0027DC2E46|nr:Fic family protein [Sinomonas sp. ASV322]MDQ4503952.1 Fic family protein [Sinomonas sp. ASV322]
MKLPMPPPDPAVSRKLMAGVLALGTYHELDDSTYLPWDELRYRPVPEILGSDADHELWWAVLMWSRRARRRNLGILQSNGEPFGLVLTDRILKASEQIARETGGRLGLPEDVLGPSDRNQYIVRSLVEEAITSSQLEGASTSRRVAKEMLDSGREPVNKSELMIVNNYVAMQRIRDEAKNALTPAFVLELHRILTDGTLDDPEDAGRLETPDHERVAVWDNELKIHTPPPAEQLPDRLHRLCDFANGKLAPEVYLPPVVRAVVVHFMAGYDHYFADGNGRTARALFYWSMLHEGYWLSQYVTISKILRKAPSRYSLAYRHTEDDDGDLTYFIHHQLDVILRAIRELNEYIDAKGHELRSVRSALRGQAHDLNQRQLQALEEAVKDDSGLLTVKEHAGHFGVSGETARADLGDLERRGYLVRSKAGKQFVWKPAPGLAGLLGR